METIKTQHLKKYLFLALLAITLFQCKYPVVEPEAPPAQASAAFTVETNLDECPAPCTVTFTNTSSNASSYAWNFGDPASGSDNTSTEVSPQHLFNNPGNYTVTLTANGEENQDQATSDIVVRAWQCGDSITDLRDGRVYSTVWVDEEAGNNLTKPGQCWMAENLRFESNFSNCYDLNDANCDIYGRLYDHFQLSSNFCPAGWKLGTNDDWDKLFQTYGLVPQLVSIGTLYNGNPSEFLEDGRSGMEIKLAGSRFNTDFTGLTEDTFIWTESKYAVSFSPTSISVTLGQFQSNIDAYIRCIQE